MTITKMILQEQLMSLKVLSVAKTIIKVIYVILTFGTPFILKYMINIDFLKLIYDIFKVKIDELI